MNTQPSVFIADDDKLLSGAIKSCLEEKNYTVTLVHNGTEALEVISTTPFDIILLDIMMPGKTGVEIVNVLKETKPDILKHVIVMTSLSDYDLLSQVLDAGVKTYIEKTETTPERIVEAVELKLKENKA